MILGLKNISIPFVILFLVSIGSVDNFAIAINSIKNQPQLMTSRQSNGKKPQINPIFRSILPKLTQKTQIHILLPQFIPESGGENPLYAILETAIPNKYEIMLGFSPECTGGNACRLGSVAAEAVTKTTPRLKGKPVALARNIKGYFEDYKCGANCSDATITWRQKSVQYTVGLKAGDRPTLVKMANSAIIS
jgi:hypothetical protein